MTSMNTRLNIGKLDGNNVQKNGGSKQVGFKQLGSRVKTRVHGIHFQKRVWFEVELQGAQETREVEVIQDSKNDDAALNKLPSRVNLDRRGIEISSLLCPLCLGDFETVNHSFFNCELAKGLSSLFAKWWVVDIPACGNIAEWYEWLGGLHVSSNVRLFLEGVGGDYYVVYLEFLESFDLF
ncbi:RNA-directed DNA polymerase, eukaryota [Tanacetum coccineum]